MQQLDLPKFMHLSLSSTKLLVLALQVYMVTSIFYVYSSGYPQPADLIIFVAIGFSFMFFLFKQRWQVTLPMVLGLAFAFCTFTINMTHYALQPDKQFFLSSLYYVFNLGIFLYTYTIFKRTPNTLQRSLIPALALAIALECFFVLILDIKDGYRSVGTFNNPNQLSYWALLSFCILVVLRYPSPLKWFDYGLIFALLLIEMESLSKAALISFLFGFICLAFTRAVTPFGRAIMLVGCLSLAVFAIFSFQSIMATFGAAENVQKTVTRLAEIGKDSDDNLEGRGYNRLYENPQYLILGAGEGGYERFAIIPFELHSGIATLFFCYGISGATLFGLFLLSILRRLPPIYWALVFAIMLYGLTHQNIRFTYFWVFLGLIAAIGDIRHSKKLALSSK